MGFVNCPLRPGPFDWCKSQLPDVCDFMTLLSWFHSQAETWWWEVGCSLNCIPAHQPPSSLSWFSSPNTGASYYLPYLGILHNPCLTSYLDLSLTSANYLRKCYLMSASHGWGKLWESHMTLIMDYLHCVQPEILTVGAWSCINFSMSVVLGFFFLTLGSVWQEQEKQLGKERKRDGFFHISKWELFFNVCV